MEIYIIYTDTYMYVYVCVYVRMYVLTYLLKHYWPYRKYVRFPGIVFLSSSRKE